jgi:two-component system, cell cycle response regulator
VANLLAPAHVVSPFANPCEALDHIRADPAIDAVITAAELTPISGLELCWELRLMAAQRPIYILLMSSNLDERDAMEALDSGADDLINKPPKRQELYAKLRAGERMLTAQRRLIELANTDSLTSLLNRRAFFERAGDSCTKPGRVAAILLG